MPELTNEILEAYVYGELPDEEIQAVEHAMLSDTRARDFVQGLEFDIDLMTFADGELGEKESLELAERVRADNELREKADKFRLTDAILMQAYGEQSNNQIPDRIQGALDGVTDEHDAVDNIVPFVQTPPVQRWVALAATLIVGVAIGIVSSNLYLSDGPSEQQVAQVVGVEEKSKFASVSDQHSPVRKLKSYEMLLNKIPMPLPNFDDQLPQIFEGTPNDKPILLDLSDKIKAQFIPLTIFMSTDGTLCRTASFIQLNSDTKASAIPFTACRDQQGKWSIASIGHPAK